MKAPYVTTLEPDRRDTDASYVPPLAEQIEDFLIAFFGTPERPTTQAERDRMDAALSDAERDLVDQASAEAIGALADLVEAIDEYARKGAVAA